MDGFILERVQQNVAVVICKKEQSHEIILTNNVDTFGLNILKADNKFQESRRL